MKSLVAIHAWCKLIGWIASAWNKLKSRLTRINNKSQWAELPDDILEQIMERLSLKDYIGLRTVCLTWKATIDKAIVNKHCHPLPEFPILLLESVGKSSFFSLSTKGEFCPKTPLFVSNLLRFGSVGGWIIEGEFANVGSLSISFFNPVTNARVLFPTQLKFPSNSSIPITNPFRLTKFLASSKPTNSDCTLVCIIPGCGHIAFCKASNKSWTLVEAKKGADVSFVDVEILDGKLHAIIDRLSKGSLLFVYDLDFSDTKPENLVFLPRLRRAPEIRTVRNTRYFNGHVNSYLAKDEASGELLLILTKCNSAIETEYVQPPQIHMVYVFKLDLSNERKPWVKVDSLGDRMIFVDSCKSIVMSRAEFDSTEESIIGNSIYFAFKYGCPKNPWWGFKLGRFCLTDNRFKFFSVDKSIHADIPFPFWFVPSVW